MPVWYEVIPFDEDTPLDIDEIANPREVPWHRLVRVWQDHTSWWHMSAKPEWELMIAALREQHQKSNVPVVSVKPPSVVAESELTNSAPEASTVNTAPPADTLFNTEVPVTWRSKREWDDAPDAFWRNRENSDGGESVDWADGRG